MQQYQKSFAGLDIAEQAQSDDGVHTAVHHEAFSGIDPTIYGLLRLDKKSNHHDTEDFGAWYTYIDSEVERSRNGKSAACELTSIAYSEEVFEPLKRIQNSGPPKRFRRRGAMWKTMMSRMLSGRPDFNSDEVVDLDQDRFCCL
jgi:hypothetical protein